MRGHFIWSDLTETHVNLFTEFAQIPTNKGFLILHAKYLDSQGTQTHIGHWIGGKDHYYVSATGAGPNNLEFAMWNDPTTGNTRATVYELKGYGIETLRTDVRVNTFPNQRVYDGVLVSDSAWETARVRSFSPEFLSL